MRIKPSASRSRSSELYYFGTGFKLSPFAEVYRRIVVNGENLTIDDLKAYPEMSPKALLNLKADLNSLLDSYPLLKDKAQHEQAHQRISSFLKRHPVSQDEQSSETKDEDFMTRNPKDTEELDDWIARNKMKYSFTRNHISSIKELGEFGKKIEEKLEKKKASAAGTSSELFDDGGKMEVLDQLDSMEENDEEMESLEEIDKMNDEQFAKEQEEIRQMIGKIKGNDMEMLEKIAQSGWEADKDTFDEEINEEEQKEFERDIKESFVGDEFEQTAEEYEDFLKEMRTSEAHEEKEERKKMRSKAEKIQKRLRKGETIYDIWKNNKEGRL